MARKKAGSRRRGSATTTSAPERSEFDLAGSPERGKARLAALAEKLGRAYGRSTMLPLAVAPNARVRRLPFGILMLDWLTGGGVVLRRLNRLVGPKSTLKTTLCLRVARSAQGTCRHCLYPLVKDPITNRVDCRCPSPRFWLADEEDYAWLPTADALRISAGHLPEAATWKNVRGTGRIPILKCAPPPHVKGKAREIAFREDYRCEPFYTVMCETEDTLDEAWVRANGVDPELVNLVAVRFGEQALQSVEEAVLARDADLVVIDSTSMLEPKGELEKLYTDRPKVAARAQLLSRFVRRHIAAAAAGGLTARYRPTVLTTSQVVSKGLGYGQHSYVGSTDSYAVEHAISLDVHLRDEGYTFDAAKQRAMFGEYGFVVRKNKAGGSPGVKGTIRFWLVATPDHPVGDSDDLQTVMSYARDPAIGLITEGTGDEKLVLATPYVADGRVPFARVGDCHTFLQANPTVYADLRARVLEALMARGAVLTAVGGEAPAADAAVTEAENFA